MASAAKTSMPRSASRGGEGAPSPSSTGKRRGLSGAVDGGERSRAFSALAGRSKAVEKLWTEL
jgi:hypothetical protein